jgi:hypothetical protein
MTIPGDLYLSPADFFVSYARMKGTQKALPETKDYYDKQWRLMAGLFGIFHEKAEKRICEMWKERNMLERLVEQRNRAESFDIPDEVKFLPDVMVRQREELHRRGIALLEIYEQMGGSLLAKIFPEIEGIRVLKSRLQELGLPLLPPDAAEEMKRHLDEIAASIKEEKPAHAAHSKPQDDITLPRMNAIKISEELKAREEIAQERDIELIRQRAIEQAVATRETVDAVLYDMPVKPFLDLTKGFPKISRVHFAPPVPPEPEVPPPLRERIWSVFFPTTKKPYPYVYIPGEEEPVGEPSPEYHELNERMESLRKENPSLFEKYSEARLRHAVEQIIRSERTREICNEW